LQATIKTNYGEIVINLLPEETPKTVDNFVSLSKSGFYDGVIFHRVIPNFMIQGGDPDGTGRGGPGYQFEDEIVSSLVFDTPGKLAMANAGPNTNGSQFFIMHKDYPLPYQYTIFGKVTEGLEVIDKIASIQTDSSDRPLEEIIINKITIYEE